MPREPIVTGYRFRLSGIINVGPKEEREIKGSEAMTPTQVLKAVRELLVWDEDASSFVLVITRTNPEKF